MYQLRNRLLLGPILEQVVLYSLDFLKGKVSIEVVH
jgi:hypothetical protein